MSNRSGWVHRLTEKDAETLTGVCANCGPVKLVRQTKGFRCSIAHKGNKTKWSDSSAIYTYLYAEGRVTITRAERDAMFAALGDDPKCELCECELAGNMANLDHCHETGEFRGWLCRQCNTALGQLGDNVEGLQKAIAYLNRGGLA